ncbi:MAG: hypothetical protein GWN00_40315, partial [Aliifodinibius sp.]|nr:hypothetical protein [candidate division Zixibacteria bacterium]NIT62219.1 hypothetical protein [Fodinibius sp.]NIW50599.1 hypothetical protein [Gammaproteobacteria bacterium]NIS49495.1 hypothetical protein [candidate division Zixibacteria bacterium]NIU17574.1 hypothetical protein [candidate division Zixibacteria bacterium]
MNQLVNFCSRAISVFMLILILAGAAFADQSYSKIDAYLQGVLNSTEDGEFINAYLVMKDRLSYEDLKNQTRGLAKEDRRKEV